MSDNSLYFEKVVSSSKDKNEETSQIEKILQRLALIGAIVLGVELVWLLGVSPFLPFAHIEVVSFDGMEKDLLLKKAGITANSTYITTHSEIIKTTLGTIPEVASVAVEKQFPDSLKIVVTPRTAVAISLVMVNNTLTPACIDKEGVLFAFGNIGCSVPLVSGLVFESPVVGLKLPAPLQAVFEQLGLLQDRAPQLVKMISEIKIQQKAYGGYDLVIYPIMYPIRVRMNPELNEESLRYMMLVLDVLVSKGIEVDEIDFRTGTVSYTTKEASSGER
jgi:cell division protein FtsQ